MLYVFFLLLCPLQILSMNFKTTLNYETHFSKEMELEICGVKIIAHTKTDQVSTFKLSCNFKEKYFIINGRSLPFLFFFKSETPKKQNNIDEILIKIQKMGGIKNCFDNFNPKEITQKVIYWNNDTNNYTWAL